MLRVSLQCDCWISNKGCGYIFNIRCSNTYYYSFNVKIKYSFINAIITGKGKNILNITNFISQFISWILFVILTFLFIQYAFVKLLGVSK